MAGCKLLLAHDYLSVYVYMYQSPLPSLPSPPLPSPPATHQYVYGCSVRLEGILDLLLTDLYLCLAVLLLGRECLATLQDPGVLLWGCGVCGVWGV